MAAGLGFKTFTTGEVLTAADTNGYLMQGVLVFASAAARDAAITSPQEGQFAYLKDTNVTTYYTGSAWTNLDTTGMTNPMTTTGDMVYSSSGSTPARLGIGTTGQVLSVAGGIPSWATPAAAASGMTFISRTAISAQSSVTFDNVFSTTYENYMIVFQGFFSDTSTPSVYFRWRKSGPSTHTSGYYGAIGLISYNGATSSINSNAAAQWDILKINGGSDAGAVIQCQIAGSKGCGAVINTNDNGNGIGYAGYGALSTAPMTAIGFILTTSANNMTGTVTVYGLAKA